MESVELNHVIPYKLCGCLLSELGGEIVVRFRGGFISGQTGDKKKKPETESGGCPEIPEIRTSDGNRKWKIEKYRFPMWFVKVGPCGFWFRASSSDSM